MKKLTRDKHNEPKIKGSGVSVKDSPIGIDKQTPNIVDTDPIIEAASPAIWPIGCIAKAFKFPIIKPIIKKILSCQRK